jgi:hypothetical protein
MKLADRITHRLINWMVARQPHPQRLMNSDHSAQIAERYRPFWEDEWTHNGKTNHRPPWWRPFNILLHRWIIGNDESGWHDHPRWSITILLKGRLIERTPWGDRALKPGSIVFRPRKAIHRFDKPDGEDAWTLFIVGRRNHEQNAYTVTPFSKINGKGDA